jgi:hypothetical protein
MNPNVYLKTFWRAELKPQIFVAMSFSQPFKPRFDNVFAPVIRNLTVNNIRLEPYRVDLLRTGDSILTDIMDGIAHSQFILADLSTMGRDSVTGDPYRNANVLYEVGIALACRQPHEVLLVRSDKDPFLFDVSTVPHMQLDFTDVDTARSKLQEELLARLRQQQFVEDARVQIAIAGLSNEEMSQLRYIADLPPNQGFGRKSLSSVDFTAMIAIPRLLDKQLIRVAGQFEEGQGTYVPTHLGRVVAQFVKTSLPKFKSGATGADLSATPSGDPPAS